jgi:hypothetical protein
MFFDRDGLTLLLCDEDAGVTFAEVRLLPEHVYRLLTSNAKTPCASAAVYDLHLLGKVQEWSTITFPLSACVSGAEAIALAKELVIQYCPPGWEADSFFRTRDSFFTKDGECYAQTTIRRWVPREEHGCH